MLNFGTNQRKKTHSLLPLKFNRLSHIEDLPQYLVDDTFGAEQGY